MIAPNTIVGGRYRVVKPLGGGGMKLVYLAEDLRLAARRCALAEVVDNFTNPDAQRQAVEAFQREADMLARLSNEHIPRVFDRFSEQNHHYLVMEYVDGVTLEEEMKRSSGKLDARRTIDIALQVLDTLVYLHGLEPPVIYRDLKPSNVMITGAGQAKLIDFGIARHFQPQQNATMIGTQGYAPPEQYRGKVELRSDLYALGATMHHALSGRDPANEAPFSFPPIASLCPGLEPALARLIDEALAYDVIHRVQSAAEFRQRLEAIRDGVAPTEPNAAASGAAQANGGVQAGGPAQHQAGAGASAPTPAGAPAHGRSQLRLPLGNRGAPRAASPSAPTILSAASDFDCPRCRRAIPSDSRFCSFCGADLSVAAGNAGQADRADHEAETVLLSVPPAPAAQERRQGPPRSAQLYRRSRSARRPLLVLVLIFVGAFAAVRAVSCLNLGAGDSAGVTPDAGRADVAPAVPSAPPGTGPPGPDESARMPDDVALRLEAFRAALATFGLTGVRFRMVGDTMELWGTVPDETDKATVRMLAFNVAGVASLRDNIRVQNSGLP